jgi:tetratricopeptide (TPR) repeat protein
MAQGLLGAGVPHVVGMNHSVPDLKATDWAQNFYQSLAEGKTIHSAAGNARHTLFTNSKESAPTAWSIPVLYTRHTFTRLTARPLQQGKTTAVAQDELVLINEVPFHQRGFIGRRREQRELLHALRSGERSGILITAQGGEGKSALAIRLAKILEADDDYQLLVYKTSEYEETFLEPLEPLISAHPRLAELRRTKTETELLEILVQEILPQAKILLLLDNFEVLLDRKNRFRSGRTGELVQKLMNVSAGDFRLIITSRRKFVDVEIPDNVLVYPIPSLSRAETIKKINRLKPLYALSFKQKKDIHSKLGGSPKAVELLNGFFEQKPDLNWGDVKVKIPKTHEKMLNFISYDLCYKSLSQSAQQVIRKMSLLERPFLKDAFYFVCSELSKDMPGVIPELLRVSLLQKMVDPRYRSSTVPVAETFAVHPIVAAPLQGLLAKNERQKINLQIGRYFERLGTEISGNPLDYETACEYYWQARQPKLAEELLFGWLQHFWNRSGQYIKMITFSEKAIEHSDSPKGKATADNWKATAFLNQGHYDPALQLFEEVLKLDKEIGDRAGMANTMHQMATVQMEQGHYDPALQLFEEVLKLEKEIGDRAGMAATLAQIGVIYFHVENFIISSKFIFASYLILNQIKGADLDQAAKNFNAATSRLPEVKVKQIMEETQKELAAGKFPEIVPLK